MVNGQITYLDPTLDDNSLPILGCQDSTIISISKYLHYMVEN